MHLQNLTPWTNDHVFDQDQIRAGERRTLIVVILTAVMMVAEIGAGHIYGSMALLADGLHMASHATALGISLFAYIYARRRARDRRYAFGSGKVNALGGFAGAMLLAIFAILMAVESTERLINPINIAFTQAIFVAVVGLVVNGVSAWILLSTPHQHDHGHGSDHGQSRPAAKGKSHHIDHNLRSAYLHVLADALTSILAIVALLAGKYWGAAWLDPLMGIVGAILVARWSVMLLGDTAAVLLDREAPDTMTEPLRQRIETGTTDRIADLHMWSIGPGIYAAEIVIVSNHPMPPEHYKALIPPDFNVVHPIIEVHHCPGESD